MSELRTTALQLAAARRVQRLFEETDIAERPADLIADIIHYCQVEGIDFQAELDAAEQYVLEEASDEK
jgi:hypothetical protein